MVEAVDPDFGSFQATWPQLAEEDPEAQTALEEWAASTDGQFQFLKQYEQRAARGHERADDRSGRHLQRSWGERADAGRGGHLYSERRGDLRPRRRWPTLPALTVRRARARRLTAQPGYYVGTPGPAARRRRRRARIFRVTGATSAAAEVSRPCRLLIARPARARRSSTPPACTAAPARARRRRRRRALIFRVAGATSSAAEKSTLPAPTVWRARARLL